MSLREFFVVTKSSVYRVSNERNEAGGPTIQKIDDNSVDGTVKVGGLLPAGENETVIITRSKSDFRRNRLHVCHPDVALPKNRIYLDISTRTSPIVGLFLNREDALKCSEVEGKGVYDSRWEEDTLTAELVIGHYFEEFYLLETA